MATLSDSLVSSSARRLTIRKRPDLTARKQTYLGLSYWVVKEPIGLNYFRFQEEEYAILQHIDGQTSLDELKDWFEAEFPPQKITLEELQQFIGMLHRSGLVIADVPGQGTQLNERRSERRRRELLGAMTNILCIRFKGFDPERLLTWLYGKLKWLFSPLVFALSLILIISAISLVTVQFDTFYSKLPSFHGFFNKDNALWLVITLALTKVIHEFGHGLTCKHFGGECHEMGVMVLVLTPCLYCNVSDSWMLPNKWHRAAIGAAGMYVELVLASLATYFWWFSTPGLLNMICLNIIFVSSVSTIMFNANPLLRYDGYYILSDVMEIPNLRQKASSILSRKMGELFLGIEPPEDPFLPQRNQLLFAIYSVASAIYRWVVVLSILWFLNKVFKPARLDIIGHAIVAMALVGLVGMPLYKLYKYFKVPGRMYKVKKPRMYASLGGLTLLVAFILFVPLPHSVMCPLEIRPRDAARVYVGSDGALEEVFVRVGDEVKPDQPLGRLKNIDIDVRIARLTGEIEQLYTRLAVLKKEGFDNPNALKEMPALEKAIASTEKQLEQQKTDQAKLLLRAPPAGPGQSPDASVGLVMPPPWRDKPPMSDKDLPPWSGSPLEPHNLGIIMAKGDVFCLIGNPANMEAILYIDQGDIEFVEKDQSVEIRLDELPFQTFESVIDTRATSETEVISRRMSTSGGGPIPVSNDGSGSEKPQGAYYQASVALKDPDGWLRIGLRGQAKIHTAPQSLGQRLWRLINQVLRFKL